MKTSEILAALPGHLAWMVLFRVAAIRTVAPDIAMRAMFFLPDDVDLGQVSHVVLTSGGRCLAPVDGTDVRPVGDPALQLVAPGESSLADRHRANFARLRIEQADCLAVGTRVPLPASFLHLELRDGVGHATALFRREPDTSRYHLLDAVGVTFVGGEWDGDCFVARFRNRLATHMHAGALGGFARTAHCNAFFLNHGEVAGEVADGLFHAFEDRRRSAQDCALRIIHQLAAAAVRLPLAMTCQPPAPGVPFAYGDLVPLGFLLRALSGTVGDSGPPLRRHVLAGREDNLWAFHTGRLVTATDTALMLLGLADRDSAAALDAFADGGGGYLPQRASAEGGRGHMRAASGNRHWQQADFPTTCLVRAAQVRAGLAAGTPISWIEERFERRSGLFFANPYLTDWSVALAVAEDPAAEDLRASLLDEVLHSANTDGSFGRYDVALSTALAVLTLEALGYGGRALLRAQIRLLDLMEGPGVWPRATPFYSTQRLEAGEKGAAMPVTVAGRAHELSLYLDTYRMIGTAMGRLALAAPRSDDWPEAPRPGRRSAAHPRYACANVEEYVASFALPPYVQ